VLERIGYLPRTEEARAKKKSGRRSAMAASPK